MLLLCAVLFQFVTSDTVGHGIFLVIISQCVIRAVVRYIVISDS